MKKFLISSLDTIVTVIVGVVLVVGVISGLTAMATQGFLMGLSIMLGALVWSAMFGGVIFVLIGIHENTARMADDIAALRAKS